MFSNNEYPIFLEKFLEEMNKHNGQMTREQFNKFMYNIRFTKEDLNNLNLSNETKRQMRLVRPDKKTVKGFRKWLNLNGYLTISYDYQKLVLTLKND